LKEIKKSVILFLLFVNFLYAGDMYDFESTNSEEKTLYSSKKELFKVREEIKKAIQKSENIPFFWNSLGKTYLYGFNFKDGFVAAEPKKAEIYFKKAYELGDVNSYYLMIVASLSSGEVSKSLFLLDQALIELSSEINENPTSLKRYTLYAHLYMSVVIENNMQIKYIHKAIDYGYILATKYEDRVAQIEIATLYRMLNKEETAKYFYKLACLDNDQENKKVDAFCRENVEIVFKKKTAQVAR